MAGLGSRFSEAGYNKPKPLIEVHGVPMIRLVIENLRPKNCAYQFIFIIQKEHVNRYGLNKNLIEWGGENTKIIQLDGLTDGAACTVLSAKELINSDSPLMIANCDQFIDFDVDIYLKKLTEESLDGQIMTMYANDPKWSFIDFDRHNLVTKVVEKQVISDEATVGIYNFATGVDFVTAAEEMISDNERVNGEFYVAPVYNKLIKNQKKIGFVNIGSDLLKIKSGMFGLGTPKDLDSFHKDIRTVDYVKKLFLGK
jgi:NDP-sugar pyrophosphorylase family protein